MTPEKLSEWFDHYQTGRNLANARHDPNGPGGNGYGRVYDELLSGRTINSVLEIGVLFGDGLQAWRGFLPAAQIVGVDINARVEPQGVRTIRADATDGSALNRELGDLTFDVIVDDASHLVKDQIVTRCFLWPRLNPGGLYIIEDVQASPSDTAELDQLMAAIGGATVHWGTPGIRGACMLVQEKSRC